VPYARLSWPSRQLLGARKYTLSYRIVSNLRCGRSLGGKGTVHVNAE